MQAVILSRVSSKEQEEGHSLVAQINRLRDYCSRKSLDIIQEFTIVESSTRGERPAFQKMIDFIKKQKSKVALVCDKVDRLQRSFREVPILEQLRKSDKLVLHFISDGQVLDSNANNSQIMAYQMFVMMAENYTNCISNNVKRSFEKKLKEGTILGSTPVGYLNFNKSVIIDPDRGDKILQMFNHYASGLTSIRDMVDYAKTIGLIHKNGKHLSRSQIHIMLHNPFYYGQMQVKGKLYPHIYEKLIPKSLWDQCQDIIHKRHSQSTHSTKLNFMLSGLVRCKYCGLAYSPYLSKHKYPFLQPPTNKCTGHYNVAERVIMDELERVFRELHFRPSDKKAFLAAIEKERAKALENRTHSLSVLNEQAGQLRNKKDNLVNLFLERGIGRADFDLQHKRLESELLDNQYRMAEFDSRESQFYSNLADCVEIADSCYFLLKSSRFEQKRHLIKLITSNLFLEGKKPAILLGSPFNLFVKTGGRLTWLGQLDSNQRHTD